MTKPTDPFGSPDETLLAPATGSRPDSSGRTTGGVWITDFGLAGIAGEALFRHSGAGDGLLRRFLPA